MLNYLPQTQVEGMLFGNQATVSEGKCIVEGSLVQCESVLR